ncbi:hypothetical protein BG006_008826 [Podila minutissima]|uniref:FAD-binding domain-containing protein n=1 Tax=Podila minutissima TaxID=64525 RepID=A0A9P5SF79_9FUNG|nr:hypothetical protein BG006_008826 [Podila minutissima]
MVHNSPHVLISGAGLGGLTLAMALEKAKIPYTVLERAAKVKHLGASLALNSNVIPALSQFGLLPEIEKMSKPVHSLDMYREDLSLIGAFDVEIYKDITGYENVICSRPMMYDLLLSKVPSANIHMNSKVVSVNHSNDGVTVQCADGTTYSGDILIGADGAYSTVRQSLYETLEKDGKLPESDKGGLGVPKYICMVGTTRPLDATRYPGLEDDITHFSTCLGNGKPHSWTTSTVYGNKISWSCLLQLDADPRKDGLLTNPEWGPNTNQAMIDEIYNFPIKNGGVLGYLIDSTDPELISKVYIEEKIFETWNHGAVALIGDACHKMQPSAGQGAVNAMQDAIILANCIYDIEEPTAEHIAAALQDYREQRYPHALFQTENSKMMGKLMYGQTWSERLLRTVVYNLPKWLQSKNYLKASSYRPLVTFLPPVPNTTNLNLLYQKPSKRYAREQAESSPASV